MKKVWGLIKVVFWSMLGAWATLASLAWAVSLPVIAISLAALALKACLARH